ncbi:MAG TPA: hypothetical protein DHW45_15590 [Candidatus Latescibacteria bacterium]|jgi:dihydrodipicolinate synthase/N-acetylneuraminate lyase|nr:hypothetical protein [Candidatus Latescibacterota bacterium]
MTPFQERLQGSIPALVTPLKQDFTVDSDAIKKTAIRALDNGSQGVVVVGTSGEFAGINDGQRAVAIKSVVEASGGRGPVIVGCGQPNVAQTHDQAREAADLGADGILVNPPFYFPMSQDEVVNFFADLVKTSPIPVMLYNIPSMTKVSVEPSTLPRLRDEGVQGCKDSSDRPSNTLAYLKAVGKGSDFRIIVGGESFFLHLLDAGVCGTTGLVPGIAPQHAAGVYEAWASGDHSAAFKAQHDANAFADIIRNYGPFPIGSGKAVLSGLNLMERWVAPPKSPLAEEEAGKVFELAKPYLPEFAETLYP